jgi:hypothetical protein
LSRKERDESALRRARKFGNWVYEVRGAGGELLARANDKASARRYQLETGGRIVKVASRNPAASKSISLRNMALVTIKRLPGGAVAVSGRRMKGR